MKTPLNFIQDKILAPIYNFRKEYLSKAMVGRVCLTVSNFIYDKSKETAIILLTLNAISTISSHIAQIVGLKKNKRENSDYLITQEWQELGLDLIFTIIPPFILNKFLTKKLDSGEWTTKSVREFLLKKVVPTIGATAEEDLYSTQHIVPARETIGGMIAESIKSIRDKKEVNPSVNKFFKFLEKNKYVRIPDKNKVIPKPTLDDIMCKYDSITGEHARDWVCGQRNGILIMAAIGYTIIASCIITPIIKNKLANKRYQKKMEKERMRLEKIPIHKTYDSDIYSKNTDSNIFSPFLIKSLDNIDKNNSTSPPPGVFDKFNTFNSYSSQSNGLRI